MNSDAQVKTFFLESASKDLTQAVGRAIARGRETERHVQLAHVVLELLKDETVARTISEETRRRASAALLEQLGNLPKASVPAFGFSLNDLIDPAKQLSQKWVGTATVSPLAFLATCLNASILLDANSQRSRELLRASGLTLESLLPSPEEKSDVLLRDFRFESLGFGTDLTSKAAAGFWKTCPLIGMENELRKLIKVLNAKADSVVLIGEPGVGKSALIEGLAYKIVHKDRSVVPDSLDSWTIVMIEAGDIIERAGIVGGLERELKKMLAFFRKNPTVIPFFDEIHRLLDATDDNIKAIGAALKPPMANGLFRCVGATTNKEYAQFIASDDAMRSRFRRVQLVEPDAAISAQIIGESTQRLLEGRASELGVSIGSEAVTTAVSITTTYQRTERLPRKAINLLKIAVSEKVYEVDMTKSEASREVSSADVSRVFSDLSDIPVEALNKDRSAYFKLVADKLAAKVIGQRAAIDGVTRWLSLQSKGWFDPRRPRGRFVFTGPPGVGKTELARGLAEELMRDPEALIVLDMGDYQDDMAVSKFMGASPGYIGFGATPTIYTRVMTRPYSVIVFDEFEKCNPALSNPLLSILDGFGEDSRGNRIDFSQAIMILTSNSVSRSADISPNPTSDESLRSRLKSFGGMWTSPLLDRIDRVCCFETLGEETLASILDSLIKRRRLTASQPLPNSVGEIAAKRAILASAVEDGGQPSARRLERAFLEWLDREANEISEPDSATTISEETLQAG